MQKCYFTHCECEKMRMKLPHIIQSLFMKPGIIITHTQIYQNGLQQLYTKLNNINILKSEISYYALAV